MFLSFIVLFYLLLFLLLPLMNIYKLEVMLTQ